MFISSHFVQTSLMKMDRVWSVEEVKRAPSILAGLPAEKEMFYRREGCTIIAEISSILDLDPQITAPTACVIFHRFYMVKAFQEHPRELTALASVFIAAKVKEFPKKCDEVCTIAEHRYPRIYGHISNLRKALIDHERTVLSALDYNVLIDVPYGYILEFSEKFPAVSRADMETITQTAWTYANVSFATTMCLSLVNEVIAVVMLQLAFDATSISPVGKDENPRWWSQYFKDLSMEDVRMFGHMVLQLFDDSRAMPALENNALAD